MKKSIIIFFVCFLFIFSCEEFVRRKVSGFGGSYPFVESWKIKASEREVLEAIKELKNEKLKPKIIVKYIYQRDTGYKWNSSELVDYLEKLKIDSLTPLPEQNDQNSHTDYWLYINFYYTDTKEIVYTWTRPDVEDSSITTLALVGFSKLNDSIDYRLINRDFWFVANRLEIRKFKRKILQPILDKIEERKKRR